ncbi:DNA polymerase III subunit gamma and tau [Pseudolysinimonas sp.]|uniref:DNA polymerase III subunit gamma and tau n=1 Tax=Pseudolysinimonas sp. TaxID=2680009 RepID=UPI00286BDFFA|nr:DNA polymerase III subunit gamma and tau [Pseudolysinimonas sp.]
MVTALYRRYRPETFAELIGQAQVTDPLRTALRTDRVNHAYLFSGPRGCGKTTSARILARCLNCAEGPTDTPCGTCASCVELARDGGGSLDVVEIDAASHNGVDDARDLRERAAFAPARDRYKIFILDEAHMVTPQGFNALLKLVEEPPDHVKFIFATTEPEKVIGTIRSRTHHYPFRLVPPAQMLDYVQKMCADEQVEVDGGVLPLVVRAGGGSVRDTLSLLDQLIAGSEGGTIQYERAVALLGYTHGALLDEVVDAIAARDAGAVFGAIDRVIQTGQDPRRFVEDLLERLRDLIVVAATRDGASAVLRGVPLDEIDRMSGQSAAFGAAELSRAADVVNSALTEMTGATSPRLHLELMVARLLVPAADETERGALARVERLERRMGIDEHPSMRAVPDRPAVEPVDIRTARKAKEPAAPVAEDPTPAEVPVDGEPAPSAAPVSLQQIKDAWPEILEIVKDSKRNAWMALAASTPRAFVGDVLTVAFATEADVASFKQPQSPGESVSEQLRGAIHQVLGVRVKFLARHEAGPVEAEFAEAEPAADQPADENPLPPAPEWNVVQIPSSEPAVASPAAPEPAAPAPTEPPPAPKESASERRAPQQNTADGKARYGEAVVREILGASFIEEQPLNPTDAPAPLASLDD